ncbi:MAG: DnaD domain protein [Oscillospiraceae bacterium]
MNEVKYIIAKEQAVSISPQDADRLIDRRDGTVALLFLYLLRRGGSFTLEDASGRLGVSSAEIRRAAEALESMGLLEIRGIPAPAEELPEYRTQDMRTRTMESAEFSSLVTEVQSLLGKVLSGTELKLLFGIYDYLALPPEVILMLVSFCMERTAKHSGAGKLPTMRSIEREAYIWANREITTLDMAEEHLRFLQKVETELEKVKSAIGIYGRELSSTERKYIESWIGMGFKADSLAIAYDKTVVKTGKLQWKYMDSIVTSWHGKGLHTPEAIKNGDTMPVPRHTGPVKSSELPGKNDLERMEKLLDKVKNS